MKTRRRYVSEDRRINTLSITRSKNTKEDIPVDLIYEVLSRLPAKSIARCRCVSKLWRSMILRPCFTEFFLTRSCARPQVLFACHDYHDGLLFFSSPQPQNPDVSLSPNYHMSYPFDLSCEISVPVHGLVCVITKPVVNGRKKTVPVICNPSTGESLKLPNVNTKRVCVRSLFGYDPIDKQFKVLCMTSAGYTGVLYQQHQILTLGTGNMSWRKIKCCISHSPACYFPARDICINGVLYYPARNISAETMLACFDVRSEKFRLIKSMKKSNIELGRGTMTNYHGKLGLLFSEGLGYVSERSRSIELWVLDDFEKQEWSEHVYVLPPMWKNVVDRTHLLFVGVTRTNEIVLRSANIYLSFCMFYYNIETTTFTRVEIQGLKCSNNSYTFLDHVEDVTLMRVFN